MRITAHILLVAVLLAGSGVPQELTKSNCPVVLLRGAATPDRIAVTFRNVAGTPIRELRFHCKLVDARRDKAELGSCSETKAHFLPGKEYTTMYSFAVPGPVLVSVKNVVFADGREWKPEGSSGCKTLKIRLKQTTQPGRHPLR